MSLLVRSLISNTICWLLGDQCGDPVGWPLAPDDVNSPLRDQVGAIAGTGEPAVPGPLSENETPRRDRLGTRSSSGKARHQFTVVDAGEQSGPIQDHLPWLVTHEARLVQRRFDRLQ